MIKCIVVEDQPPAQRLLKKYIAEVDDLHLLGIFGDAMSAMEFMSGNNVDLIFLDVHLPKLSGLDFMSILSPRPYVVLTTAFPEYALQGYEMDVVDYLLKPFTFERFYKSVLKVERLMQKMPDSYNAAMQPGESVVVKEGHHYSRVNTNDIIYLKSDGDYTYVVTTERKYMTLNSLKYWLGELPKGKFCQVHRSFVVNFQHVQKATFSQVTVNNICIPVGRVFKSNFMSSYSNKTQSSVPV